MNLPESAAVMESELKLLPDSYCVLACNIKRVIPENDKRPIDFGLMFYFPIEPKES